LRQVSDVGRNETINIPLSTQAWDLFIGSPRTSDRQNVEKLVSGLAGYRRHRRSHDLVQLLIEEIPHAAGEIPSNSKASTIASLSSQG
jgi:hypothetical protein